MTDEYLSHSVRGYQFKSEKSQSRRNPPAYRPLVDDKKEKLAEAEEVLSQSADVEGMGEKVD